MAHRICWKSSDHTSETIDIRADMLAAIIWDVPQTSGGRVWKKTLWSVNLDGLERRLRRVETRHNRHAKQEIREIKGKLGKSSWEMQKPEKFQLEADT